MNNFQLKKLTYKHRGVTLIELLISTVISLIILASVLFLFVAMLESNNDNMQSVRLHQELRSTMSLMVRNIRRSGSNMHSAIYTTESATDGKGTFQRLEIKDVDEDDPANDFDCILFFYDKRGGIGEGTREANEKLGYRLKDEAVEAGGSCGGRGEDLTDNSILITELKFDMTILTADFDGIQPTRRITITLEGQLKSDPLVTHRLEESVNIRNTY